MGIETKSGEQGPQQITLPESSEGLRGRQLVAWALKRGETVVEELKPVQRTYFEVIARNAGVEWPSGFFEKDVESLMRR